MSKYYKITQDIFNTQNDIIEFNNLDESLTYLQLISIKNISKDLNTYYYKDSPVFLILKQNIISVASKEVDLEFEILNYVKAFQEEINYSLSKKTNIKLLIENILNDQMVIVLLSAIFFFALTILLTYVRGL